MSTELESLIFFIGALEIFPMLAIYPGSTAYNASSLSCFGNTLVIAANLQSTKLFSKTVME